MEIVEFTANDAPVCGYLHEVHSDFVTHAIRPALIVCPGGAYGHLSAREADPPAMEYFSMGYNVFILRYSLLEKAGNLRPLKQLAETVCTVRKNSSRWRVDPNRIAVMGFSAGGHLVASLGALWNHPAAALPVQCRPDALILCYPVITMGESTHAWSRENVTGGDEALRQLLSLENQVTPDFPPAFVWHTVDDESVPVENSMLLIAQLKKNRVPFECHFFAHGKHGLAVCNQDVETPSPECREWIPLSKTWLNNRFSFQP